MIRKSVTAAAGHRAGMGEIPEEVCVDGFLNLEVFGNDSDDAEVGSLPETLSAGLLHQCWSCEDLHAPQILALLSL